MAEHFVHPPGWHGLILTYFFLGGLSGGTYALATLLRLLGRKGDEMTARIGFLIAFPLLLPCPVLLALDLGLPLRFWHMLINMTPGQVGPILKPWTPMSVGSWMLLIYGLFSFISFIEALAHDGRIHGRLGTALINAGGIGKAVNIVGAISALFIASYTGVLLSVSNQPVWSDTWALGGLFLASALSGSAALLSAAGRYRREAEFSHGRLKQADAYFAFLEVILIVVFFVTLAPTGALSKILAIPLLPLWLLVGVGVVTAVGALTRWLARSESFPARMRRTLGVPGVAAVLVLIGVLALRAAVIFSVEV